MRPEGAMTKNQATMSGRFSLYVVLRRVRSLGFVCVGDYGRPRDKYLVPVKRNADGATGVLEMWWDEKEGWSQRFRPDQE